MVIMSKKNLLIDSHCHLDFSDFDADLPKIVEKASDAGISKILTICTKISNLKKTIQIAELYDSVYFAFGLHPLNVGKETIDPQDILQAAAHKKMIGIGETGLDYYYSKETAKSQKKSFIKHIELSQALQLPLIVHSRAADQDMKTILVQQYKRKPFTAVMHCFTSGQALARSVLDLGFYLSMSGIVTFSRNTELTNIFSKTPLDKVLIETDSPYLAPAPFRGKRNEPSFITNTCKKGAEIMGVSEEEFKIATTKNFKTLFWKVTH